MIIWQLVLYSGYIIDEKDIKQLVSASKSLKDVILEHLLYIENITNIKNYIKCRKIKMIGSFHRSSNIIYNYLFIELCQNCNRLLYINLSNNKFITNNEIYTIANNCITLISINVSRCNLLTNSLGYLSKKCKKLSWINLSQLTIDKKYILQFVQNCNKLKSINFEKTLFIYLKNEIINEVSIHCNKLNWLNLSDTNVSDDNVLQILKQTNQLTRLKLENCFYLTDKLFINGSKYLCNLEVLNINNCEKITFKSFKNNLIKYCHKIQYLDMKNCWRIRSNIIKKLVEVNPLLKKINIQECMINTSLKYYLLSCYNIIEIEH